MTKQSGEVTVEFLEAFADAWNRHDVDDLSGPHAVRDDKVQGREYG